jgi:RHS repeat-associated protein
MTDGTGQIVNEYSYGPNGERTGIVEGTPNPFGYVGRYGVMEEGNGLKFMRARYYDETTGRFLNKDLIPGSITKPQSLNRYAYVSNNSVNGIDPSGLLTAVIWGAPISSNPFGHAAIATTGDGVVSFGTGTPPNSSLTAYLLSQADTRDSTVYIINTTPEQEQAIQSYLSQFSYNLPSVPSTGSTDTCASRTNGALSQAHIGSDSIMSTILLSITVDPAWSFSPFPSDTAMYASMLALATGGTSFDISKGATVLPGIINNFNPR